MNMRQIQGQINKFLFTESMIDECVKEIRGDKSDPRYPTFLKPRLEKISSALPSRKHRKSNELTSQR